MTPDQEFDIACQVNEGPICDKLEMLSVCYKENILLKIKVADLEEWIRYLRRQLRRYERGNAG